MVGLALKQHFGVDDQTFPREHDHVRAKVPGVRSGFLPR